MNPFSNPHSLVSEAFGVSKYEIDQLLQDQYYAETPRCVVCTSTTVAYQLILKGKENVAQKVYVCSHCVPQLDPKVYKLKKLGKDALKW